MIKGSGSLKSVNDALISFGDSKVAAAALAKVGVEKGISDEVLTTMLQSAYGTTIVTANSAGNIMSEALSNAKSVAPQASSAISGVSGAFNTAKTAASGFLTTIKAILPTLGLFAIGTAAVVAGKFAWDHIFTNNAANKQYDKSVDKYNNAKSEVDSLQSQYDSNYERIQELRSKANRSPDENTELANLQKENKLIVPQKNIKEKIADTAQHAQAIDSANALNKKSLQKNYNWGEQTEGNKGFLQDIFGGGEMRSKISISDLDEANEMIIKLNNLKKERDKIINNRSTPSDSYFSAFQSEERKIKDYDTQIQDIESNLSDRMSDISDKSQKFWDSQGNLVEESTRDTATKTEKLLDDYAKATGSTDRTEDKLKNIFALADYADLQSKLESIGKSKGSKGLKKALKDDKTYSSLLSALNDKNVSTDDLTDYIMSIAAPDKKNIEGIKQNLKDEFSYNKKLNEFFKDKSDKDIEGFWDYYQSQGFDAEEYNWKKKDLSDNWDKYLKTKEKTKEEGTPFSSLFKNSAEDTASDLDTVTDNFQSSISSIKSAMDSLKSGDMKNSDITDLIQQFPELATETDDLQTGLQKLATDKASTAIGKIRDAVKDTTDPKELAAADKYVQSILDSINTAGFDMSNTDIRDTAIKNLRTSGKGFEKDYSERMIKKLTAEYGDNEIAMQAILKLSLDPSMANASYEEWKSAIEDTEVQVRLDANDQDLENLSKDLTRLQTDASDMQTLMNNKSALNQKVTAEDYNNLVENGNAQISNLNKQIKDYQDNIDSVKNSKLILSDEDNEKIKGYQDQIQSAQMSIENMKASQAGWLEEIANLPITDVTNLASALSTAIGETNSETGLTSDSVKNLVTQFSDLTAQGTDINNLFSRSANGLKLNTERFKDLSEMQNQMVMDDFAKQIKAQQDAIANPKNANNIDTYKNKLEELKNLQAEYMAQYEGMQSQLSDFQIMQNSKSAPTEGSEYTQAKSDLEAAKELYDQGLTGTPQFKKTAKYFSQGGFEDADNFIENYNSLKDYYTDDFSGPKKFLNELNAKGLATYETLADGNKQWTLSFSDTETAANQMGMSLESFESILGRLGDYDFVNTFVSSIADGENQIDDLTDQLIEEQGKLSKMRANGASEQQIKDQEEVVNGLQQQISDTKQATEDYAAGEGERQAKSLAEAKQQIDDYNKYRQEALNQGDTELAQKYEDKIQEVADEKGIKLKVDSFEVDENAYNQLSHEQGIGTFDSPLTAEEMGISDPTAAKEYANSLEAVKQAHEANAEATEADFNALKQYTAADLEGIQLGDGAYNVEGMEQAEDALQNLADQAGLTKDQLVQALEGLGVLKPEVDSSEIEEAGEKAEETHKVLENMDGSTTTLNADLSNADGVEKFISDCQNMPTGVSTTITADVSGEDQVESLAQGLEELPKDQSYTFNLQVDSNDTAQQINEVVSQLNAGRSEEAQIHANIVVKDDEVNSYKPKDKEGKAIYHLNASEVNAWTPPVKGGTVNYTVNAGSVNAWTPPVKGGTVQYRAVMASGTMTSIAHADGTAYNMLNLKPLSSAHAGGNVALGQNETALTNEVGTESIVRDGVWSLLPISFSLLFALVWFFSFLTLLEILSQNKLHPYVLPKSLVLDKF